jgi:hypothetical protein
MNIETGRAQELEGKMGEEKVLCSHCNQTMDRWAPPSEANWDAEFHYVCFNDECPYYKNGWKWMMDNYNVRASYRNRTDPLSGRSSPLPVWSPAAHKDAIVKE